MSNSKKIFASLVFLSSPFFSAQAEDYLKYRVQKKDWVMSILRDLKLDKFYGPKGSIPQLKALNSDLASSPNLDIKPGQVLILPIKTLQQGVPFKKVGDNFIERATMTSTPTQAGEKPIAHEPAAPEPSASATSDKPDSMTVTLKPAGLTVSENSSPTIALETPPPTNKIEVEPAATKAPTTEAAKAEDAKVETPKAEEAKVESPKIESPKNETQEKYSRYGVKIGGQLMATSLKIENKTTSESSSLNSSKASQYGLNFYIPVFSQLSIDLGMEVENLDFSAPDGIVYSGISNSLPKIGLGLIYHFSKKMNLELSYSSVDYLFVNSVSSTEVIFDHVKVASTDLKFDYEFYTSENWKFAAEAMYGLRGAKSDNDLSSGSVLGLNFRLGYNLTLKSNLCLDLWTRNLSQSTSQFTNNQTTSGAGLSYRYYFDTN